MSEINAQSASAPRHDAVQSALGANAPSPAPEWRAQTGLNATLMNGIESLSNHVRSLDNRLEGISQRLQTIEQLRAATDSSPVLETIPDLWSAVDDLRRQLADATKSIAELKAVPGLRAELKAAVESLPAIIEAAATREFHRLSSPFRAQLIQEIHAQMTERFAETGNFFMAKLDEREQQIATPLYAVIDDLRSQIAAAGERNAAVQANMAGVLARLDEFQKTDQELRQSLPAVAASAESVRQEARTTAQNLDRLYNQFDATAGDLRQGIRAAMFLGEEISHRVESAAAAADRARTDLEAHVHRSRQDAAEAQRLWTQELAALQRPTPETSDAPRPPSE
jgi:DNA repair exonuclease SbcCD ATPase subunit